jgi:hypothetical protein
MLPGMDPALLAAHQRCSRSWQELIGLPIQNSTISSTPAPISIDDSDTLANMCAELILEGVPSIIKHSLDSMAAFLRTTAIPQIPRSPLRYLVPGHRLACLREFLQDKEASSASIEQASIRRIWNDTIRCKVNRPSARAMWD